MTDDSDKPVVEDRFWKVRPLFKAVRDRCLMLEIE